MNAPEGFAAWMSTHVANDRKHGREIYRYHPRSDAHSRRLCELVLDDLLSACPSLAEHARTAVVVGGTNVVHNFPGGRTKTLDLAIGEPATPLPPPSSPCRIAAAPIGRLRLSIEAKQCMTEHSKTKPRLFDELSSAHEIVHQGQPDAIACGLVVVNIAGRYASPTRQLSTDPLVLTAHRQPTAAQSIVEHLRRLRRRARLGEVGFDAIATIVIDCDNLGACSLHTSPPAPQPGDSDHYGSFVSDITRTYAERFP